jgi:hypothetical protein
MSLVMAVTLAAERVRCIARVRRSLRVCGNQSRMRIKEAKACGFPRLPVREDGLASVVGGGGIAMLASAAVAGGEVRHEEEIDGHPNGGRVRAGGACR